jgi:hypothetical protein
MCCPAALGHACLAPSADGDCPLPDLAIDGERARVSARVLWEYFAEDDCQLVEGCIAASGWRRVLRFETFTPNHGEGDLRLGAPVEGSPNFTYSGCHDHFHFNGYADYRLHDATGAEVGMGHKQAFCLEDTEQVDDGAGVRTRPRYDCDDQGISRGWGDNYYAGLDCQFVDVTDVAPGEYTLHISINGEHVIPEVSYADNVADVPVTIPAVGSVDPLAPCVASYDGTRDCGWTGLPASSCTPGSEVEVGCGSACGLGTCEGDPIMRVCPGDTPCDSRDALAFTDDGCDDESYCPMTAFTCPDGGRYNVLLAPYATGDTDWACIPSAR